MKDEHLKYNFKLFLQYVFSLHRSQDIMKILEKNSDLSDMKIYINYLLPHYEKMVYNIFKIPIFIHRANSILNFQLNEISNQIEKITDFIRIDQKQIYSVLNVGDTGRYHEVYKKLFKNAKRNYMILGKKSKFEMWIKSMYDENMSQSIRKHDIIFSLAGLHHYSLEELDKVLTHCSNTIKKNGIFILRDHDVRDEKDNILVRNAHTVFNGW